MRVCEDCKRLDSLIAGGPAAAPTAAQLAASNKQPALLQTMVSAQDALQQESTPYDGDQQPSQSTSSDTGAALRLEGGTHDAAAAGDGGALGNSPPSFPSAAGQQQSSSTAAAAAAAQHEFGLRSGSGGGGGLGLFDDAARLAPPFGPAFNLPSSPAAVAILRSLAEAGERHLVEVVCRCAAAYISEPSRTSHIAAVESSSSAAGDGLSPLTRLGPNQVCWAGALLRLVRRSVALVDPNIRRGDRADVRCYVQVKAIPQQTPDAEALSLTVGDCEVVEGGVVFRQCLPHKGMREDVANPKILLLDGEFRPMSLC